MGRGWVGRGRRSITFGYNRRPSGRDTLALGPAPGFKGLRLTAGRRRTRVCVGLGRVSQVGPCGLCWAHLGPMLSLCWAYVGLC